MKRIFALLLVLTLFCPSALAETIRQQVNTPESLQDTFTSNTGRMTIDIKADVIVPDISTLYEIDVTPRLFNDEELSRLVKGFQQTDSQLDADYQVLFGISRLYEYKNAHIHLIASGMEDNGTWSDVTAKCVVSDETYLTGYMSVLQRMHEGPAAHCRYTLEEAKAIADQAAAIVAPNYAFSAWGLMELYPRDGSDTRTKDYDYLEGYQFCYMCKPTTEYGIMQKTHMLSPAWSISPSEAISEKTCRRRQTQGPRQTRLYLRYFRIFSSGGQRIKRI